MVQKLSAKFLRFISHPAPYFRELPISLLKSRSNFISKIAPYSLLADKYYLQYRFRRELGYRLNLKDPKTFNEKLNWIKLYYRNPLYTTLADKYAVRSYVEAKVGSSYFTKLYGVYEDPTEIVWDNLPDRFVIKATHGCNYNILCEDKAKLDTNDTLSTMLRWVSENYYEVSTSREWQYKNIPPRIMIEEYLEGDEEKGLVDYKFWCFWGKPTLISVHFDRHSNYRVALMNTDWEPVDVNFSKPSLEFIPKKPERFEEMMSISMKLTEGIPHCRVDMYYFNDRIVFGEMTLCTGGGFDRFGSYESDLLYGKPFVLPHKIKG